MQLKLKYLGLSFPLFAVSAATIWIDKQLGTEKLDEYLHSTN